LVYLQYNTIAMRRHSLLWIGLSLSLILICCKKEETASIPQVQTNGFSGISYHSVLLNGAVLEEGGSAVSLRGFCYSANPGVELNDSVESAGFGPGEFSSAISGLRSGRIYYYRAFATNGIGTAFGSEMSFVTDEEPDPGPSIYLKGGAGYTSGDATVFIGNSIRVGIVGAKSIVSGNRLTRFRIVSTRDNMPLTLLDSTFNTDSFNHDVVFEFSSSGTTNLEFELSDAGGMKASTGFNVIIVQADQTVKYFNVEMGSFNDVNGSFFSTSEGIVYNITQTYTTPANQAKIDFLFFRGVTLQNTIASPDDTDANTIADFKLSLWTNKNQTRFNHTTITPAQFDLIGANYNFPDFIPAEQSTKINQLMVGDVILFKTQNGKLGLIKIVNLYTKGDKIKIDVVLEK
jgi:hypothetical protein